MSEQSESENGETQDSPSEEAQPRILGRPGAQANFTMSQREYRPTPYQDSVWEFIGERFDTLNFYPLELEIVPSDRARTDPMFDDFGSDVPRGKELLFHTKTGEHNPAPAEEEPKFDQSAYEAALLERFEAGVAEGTEEGHRAAREEYLEREGVLKQQLTDLTESVQQQLRLCIEQLQQQAAQFAINVARKILTTTAEAKPEYIFSVIRQGVQSLGGSLPIRIRISQQDMEFIEVIGLPHDVSTAELGVEYIADENIQSGCIIETSFGEVDLQLEHMWEQVRANLFHAEKK